MSWNVYSFPKIACNCYLNYVVSANHINAWKKNPFRRISAWGWQYIYWEWVPPGQCSMLSNPNLFLKFHMLWLYFCLILLFTQRNQFISLLICDSTYQKIPVVGRFNFELQECKVKIPQNMVPRSILTYHKFWNLQYLLCMLLEEFDVKTVFLCKNESSKLLLHANTFFTHIPKL